MLNPYQQLLWIWTGNQFYFYVFGFKIRKKMLVDSPIFVTVKKPEWHILCRNISKYHHFVTSGSQDTKKLGCCCCVVEERMMPCFFWLGSPLSFRPIIETLDRKKDSLSSHLIKKVFKSRRRRYSPACANLSCQAFLAWDRFRSVIHWQSKEISYSHSIFQWVTPPAMCALQNCCEVFFKKVYGLFFSMPKTLKV